MVLAGMAPAAACSLDVDGQSPGGSGASGGSAAGPGSSGGAQGDTDAPSGEEDAPPEDPATDTGTAGAGSGDASTGSVVPGDDTRGDAAEGDTDADADATSTSGEDGGPPAESSGDVGSGGEIDLDDPDYGCGELCAVAAPCDPKIASIASCTASCIEAWDEWPLDDPACDDAHVIRNLCVGGLDCAGYAAWFGADPRAFPCFDEDQVFAQLCIDPL